MDKLIVKTAVKTVLIIVGVLVAAFAIFSFAFPQHMATASENIGNYSMAVRYASLRYSYTHDGEDLARCFDDSVLLGDDAFIIQYGKELMDRDDYLEVCEKKNAIFIGMDYDLHVASCVVISTYNQGDRAKAIDDAKSRNGVERFKMGNPLMSLAVRIVEKGDAEAAGAMLSALSDIRPTDEGEQDCLADTIENMQRIAGAV